jgi:hypothetical protein
MGFLVVLVLLLVVATFVTMPLRRRPSSGLADPERALAAERELQDLEAARNAKYREIRDAELDHGTGKLSDADWQALDGALRAEAITLLKALDRACEELRRRAEEVEALMALPEPERAGEPDSPAAAEAVPPRDVVDRSR